VNSLILCYVQLPSTVDRVNVTATGTGTVLVQVNSFGIAPGRHFIGADVMKES